MGQPRAGAGGARGSRPPLGLSFSPGAAASPGWFLLRPRGAGSGLRTATEPRPREPGARKETPGLDTLAESRCNGVRRVGNQKRRLHLFILQTAAVTPFLHAQGVFPQSGQTRGRSETERTALSLEGDVRSSAGAHGALICWRPRGAHLLAPLDAHLLAPTGRSSAGVHGALICWHHWTLICWRHGALICWHPRSAHLLAPLDAHLLAPTGRSSAGVHGALICWHHWTLICWHHWTLICWRPRGAHLLAPTRCQARARPWPSSAWTSLL